MAIVEIQSRDNGKCGFGSSNPVIITVDGIKKMDATFQYKCESSWAAYIDSLAAAYKVVGNTIYLNGALYWSSGGGGGGGGGDGDNNTIFTLLILVVLFMFLFWNEVRE